MDRKYGLAKAGRLARTYIQQLCKDESPEDLPEAMHDREEWRERVRDIYPCLWHDDDDDDDSFKAVPVVVFWNGSVGLNIYVDRHCVLLIR